MAESWHFFGFVVLLIAAFGFVYLNSSSLSSDDFSAKGYVGGRRGIGTCSASAPGYHAPSGRLATSCTGCSDGGACCASSGGTRTGYIYTSADQQYAGCKLGQYSGQCGSGGCWFGSYSPSPSPTPRGSIVTVRPTLTVRASATPTPSGSLNASGCGGNSRCTLVCAQGYSCSGAVSGACGGKCVKTLTVSTPRPSIG